MFAKRLPLDDEGFVASQAAGKSVWEVEKILALGFYRVMLRNLASRLAASSRPTVLVPDAASGRQRLTNGIELSLG